MSGFQELGPVISRVAATDLSGKQCRFVDTDANGKAILATAGGSAIGVLITNDGTAGQAVGVQVRDVAEVTLGGTVAPDDFVKSDSTGRAVTASGADVAAGLGIGRCLAGGNVNETGAILLGLLGSGQVALTESESIATSVDVSALTRQTLITLATADHVGVLANGKYVGQVKDLRVISDDASHKYTLTPTTMQAGQPAAFVFTAKGQYVQLTWASDGWWVSDIKTAGTGTTAAAGTINPLIARQGLIIGSAGLEDRILPSGYVPGHMLKIAADTVGSGTSTVTGLFVKAAGTNDGVTVTYNAALDEATYVWNGARWQLISLISVSIA